MLENRIKLAKDLLNERGNFFLNIDDNGSMYARMLLDDIFGKENFKNEIIWCYEKPGSPIDRLKNNHSTILFYAVSKNSVFNQIYVPRSGETTLTRREGRFETNYEGKISPDWWIDIPSFATMMTAGERTVHNLGVYFATQQPEKLLKRIIQISDTGSNSDIILDFFAGSGVTIAVAHKLRKKWIGIELGEHFYTIVLPRMKKVLVYDKTGISRDKDVKEKYNENNAGGFFKYQVLEQFEDTIGNIEEWKS
jgi:adenine-specific DNA-methyltransferase